LLEGEHSGTSAAPLEQGILASACKATEVCRLIAGLRERDEPHGAQADIAPLSRDDGAKNPPLGAGVRDEEVEPVAVCISAGLLDVANVNRGQSLVRMRAARFTNLDTDRV
jgi:hypothetical protein